MKKFILLAFVFILAVPMFVSAQATRTVTFSDTLITSSSTDTLTFTTGSYTSPRYYEALIAADSLSGGTTGTIYLQQEGPTATSWITIETITVDGVQTLSRKTGRFNGGRLRFYCLAGSSTQNTKVSIKLLLASQL